MAESRSALRNAAIAFGTLFKQETGLSPETFGTTDTSRTGCPSTSIGLSLRPQARAFSSAIRVCATPAAVSALFPALVPAHATDDRQTLLNHYLEAHPDRPGLRRRARDRAGAGAPARAGFWQTRCCSARGQPARLQLPSCAAPTTRWRTWTGAARAASSAPRPATTRRAWPWAASAWLLARSSWDAGDDATGQGRRGAPPGAARSCCTATATTTPTTTLKVAEAEGLTFVHPFDDPDVIAGQGHDRHGDPAPARGPDRRGLRRHRRRRLISGVAAYIKAVRPEIRIIGVQTVDSDAMLQSVRAGAACA